SWRTPTGPLWPPRRQEACQVRASRMPTLRYSSATNAAAASNACESAAANPCSVHHAARQQRHDGEFWLRHLNFRSSSRIERVHQVDAVTVSTARSPGAWPEDDAARIRAI